MKTKLERLILGSILAPLAPLACLMTGWWAAYYLLPEHWIFLGAIIGFTLGILADIPLLKKLLHNTASLGDPFWMAVFLFYSAGMFGFFMGVPLFNLLLSLPAGFVLGDRLLGVKADESHIRTASQRAAAFTTAVMFLVCIASATFALIDPYTEANLQGMLGLSFNVTRNMVVGLIVIGGAGLLILNWWFTVLSTRASYKILQRLA